jgi:hypothetical protein
MLKINQSRFPHFEGIRTNFSLSLPHPLRLSPVTADDDDLTRDLLNDPATHDNLWQLSERPDSGELEKFWSDVVEDVKQDPEWVDFSKDEA